MHVARPYVGGTDQSGDFLTTFGCRASGWFPSPPAWSNSSGQGSGSFVGATYSCNASSGANTQISSGTEVGARIPFNFSSTTISVTAHVFVRYTNHWAIDNGTCLPLTPNATGLCDIQLYVTMYGIMYLFNLAAHKLVKTLYWYPPTPTFHKSTTIATCGIGACGWPGGSFNGTQSVALATNFTISAVKALNASGPYAVVIDFGNSISSYVQSGRGADLGMASVNIASTVEDAVTSVDVS